jgi:predicted nucleic acid-binding protein
MGVKERLRGKRVYFDTNIFIYLLEGNDTLRAQIKTLQALIMAGDISIFSSELAYTEILPPAVRAKKMIAIESVQQFLENSDVFHLVPISKVICIQAGILRGETGMKTPDAIHVASAMAESCDAFLTNDAGIQLPKTIERVLFSGL